jgi:hypothetical protein
MKEFMAHWKTSAQSFLSFFIVTAITIQGALSVYIKPSPLQLKIGIGINISLALAKVWIGLLQKDPGSVPAIVPGQGVQVVAAHEVPDNPAAVPVVKP